MNTADEAPDFEAQATACLLAGTHHRARLLAVATQLTGCPEQGMDLFQQNLLNCHDAIQRRGFAGERYEFYLLASLKRLHYRQQKVTQRTRPTDFQACQNYEDGYLGEEVATLAALFTPGEHLPLPLGESPQSERQQLAEQVAAEVRARLSFTDRLLLRLHADGYSGQEIVGLTGAADRFRVRRALDRLKAQLRATFGQAWHALLD